MRDVIRKLVKDEKGDVLVLVTLLLVVFIGFVAFVVDVGQLLVTRRKMVTAADAAALAGAKELSITKGVNTSKAIEIAKEIAVQNGADESNIIVNIENRLITLPKKDDENEVKETRQIIEVIAISAPVEMTFAKVLGIDNKEVAAKAIATWGHITNFSKGAFMPLFILEDKFGMGNASLHDGNIILNGDIANSSWGYINVGNTSVIKALLIGEIYGHPMEIGDELKGETGKMQYLPDEIEKRMQKALNLGIGSDGSIDIDARRQFMTTLVPVIDDERFMNLNLKENGEDFKTPLDLPVKYFAVFEILDVVTANNGNGSSYALDPNTYEKVSSVENYSPLKKGALIGRFTDTIAFADVDINPGGQIDPNPSMATAIYFKLIQ